MPLEQNNGNTNCTDTIYEIFTNIKTQLCPNFSTGTKKCMYVPYLITMSVIQTIVSNYWMGVNNELERIKKEEIWLNLWHYPGICLERESDENHAKPEWVQLVPVRISTYSSHWMSPIWSNEHIQPSLLLSWTDKISLICTAWITKCCSLKQNSILRQWRLPLPSIPCKP